LSDYEICRNNLEELVTWYKAEIGDRNEATTRFKMIDRLLFKCLGWEESNVTLEESENGEYSDYTFSAPRRVLIVEAKKEGIYFDVPLNRDRIEYSLSTLSKDSENIKKAVEQVSNYCQRRGVPFAVISNGHQIIGFVATKNDGSSPLEGKALVFSSLDIMLSNFNEFWNSLSKEGIEKKYLLKKLSGDRIINLPQKLSSSILDYPGNKMRNIFQTDLQIVSELIFEDLTRAAELEKRFLEECYCQSGALSQYSLASKNILEARYSSLFEADVKGPTAVSATSKKGISEKLLAESLSRRPILLIGDVGVGKTTFIRNLISVNADEVFKDAITLYIDLGSQGNLSTTIKDFVLQDISRQLLENHQIDIYERNFITGVYFNELERFKKGIFGELYETDKSLYKIKEIEFLEKNTLNTEQHLKNSLEHIEKARCRQIVIVIDNADQRTEDVQQESFLIAQEFSEHWSATVFLALRPETFNHSMKQGALSGYHPKAFTINPPRIDLVLKKRLKFALKLTSGEIKIKSLQEGTSIRLENLGSIIEIFLYSLEERDDLIEFVDNISAGNVRIALDIVKGFFGSGHVDTEKILRIYSEDGSYLIPLHEFLRAVIYGDNEYYNPYVHNNIHNLFEISTNDIKEHFLLTLSIALLSSHNLKSETDGFIETSLLYTELQGLGFTPEQIDLAITRGCSNKLIESSGRRTPNNAEEMPRALRATTVGLYHINKLINLFTYIDAVVVDTVILENEYYNKILDSKDIILRIERAEIFKLYLDKAWEKVSHARNVFDWKSKSAELDKELKYIKSRLTNSHTKPLNKH
jgi:GTPase SAR1 family protein